MAIGIHLNETDKVRAGIGPLVQIGQVDLTTRVHMFGNLDLHVLANIIQMLLSSIQ